MTAVQILKENKDTILKNWLQQVRTEMPEIAKYDNAAIENSVPDLLNAIVLQLESDKREEITSNSRLHGIQRTSFKNYSLKHIIKEYNLLKSQVLHVLDAGQITNAKDRDDVIFVFDHAIEEASESFYVVKQGVYIKAREAAEKKADELSIEDENREDFIQTITHDLNSPLNNIKGCIYLLEMDSDIDKLSKIISILKTSADQAHALINDFLDVSKVNLSQKFPLVKSNFDVIEELKNQIDVFRISQDKEIEFQHKLSKMTVNLDLNLFRRSIGNLINNAIKHGNKDSKVKIACYQEERKAHLSVQNFGKTISEKNLKNVFHKYYQGDGNKKGWGIGLAFVNEVAKAHDGEAVAHSSQEEGTTFKLIFPLDQS